MNRALCEKSFRETAMLFVAVGIGMGLFSWFRVWIVGELDTSSFQKILDLIPDRWRTFTPVDFDWLISYLGRTALTLDEPMLVMLMAIFAIVRGTDVVSGEISRGTMEMLLSQPVSRRQVFWTPVIFTLIGVLFLCLIVWLGMTIGVYTRDVELVSYPTIRIPLVGYEIPLTFMEPELHRVPMSTQVDPWLFGPGVFNLFCLGVFLVGIATLCSAFDRYRWRTLGIVIGFYIVSAMIKILALASETFRWTNYLTFFYCYEPELFVYQVDKEPASFFYIFRYDESGRLMELGAMGHNLVLLLLGGIALIIADRVFHRRDIPAPV